MKHYHCGTLVPGCAWHTRDELEAEIVARALNHMHSAHGETSVDRSTVQGIKEMITSDATRPPRSLPEVVSVRE
ncbi:MAG: DUF1059 domain-containing protein [Cucumibacter sp.]